MYDDSMAGHAPDATAPVPTVWLSGMIVTFVSKVVMPVLWFAVLLGVPLWVYLTRGRISIRPDVQFIVWFALIATVPLAWLTVHLQLVGYQGRELVVANYWREARIPFENIASIDSVWWYRGRLIRIRFYGPTAFGDVVYYMPRWGSFRALFVPLEEELRMVVYDRF